MKLKLFALLILFCGLVQISLVADVSALGLKVAPLEYKVSLKDNEVQRGFIDVSNPSAQMVTVSVSVQGFRQINDNGGLEFSDNELISRGIRPELDSFELGPREALRLFFTVDSATLPEGDVYGAVFFTTEPTEARNGVGQLVRVGTILSIVNKTPGERKAELTGLGLPLLQLSDTVKGTYTIKNTGDERTGFYPTVTVSSWPGGNQKEIESSLVFGGRERSNDVSYQAGYGIRHIQVVYGDSKQSRWVILIAPWMLVVVMLVALIVAIELLLLRRRKKARKTAHKNTSSTS